VLRDWVILFLPSSCQCEEQWVLYYDVTSIELEASMTQIFLYRLAISERFEVQFVVIADLRGRERPVHATIHLSSSSIGIKTSVICFVLHFGSKQFRFDA
jgi:hypothetical protein